MIISKTPFRVSLFGGGTDLPEWLKYNKGKIFSLAIDKYCYITIRNLNEFFDYNYAITYHKREHTNSFNKIRHPVVKNLIKIYAKNSRLEIEHKSDLPARSGIGSSSSFTVGLMNAFLSKNKQISKKLLSKKAIHFEQNILNETVGNQDQIRASYGGMGFIKMSKNKFTLKNLSKNNRKLKNIENSILLVYSDVQRNASKIETQKIKNLKNSKRSFKNMNYIYEIVCEAEKRILSKNFNIKEIGQLLSEQWKYKKELSNNITNTKIDEIYDLLISKGAYGGKLLGAGSGGFIAFLAGKSVQNKIIRETRNLKILKVRADFQGSSLINPSYANLSIK